MIAFRRAHLAEVQRISAAEGIQEQSQCRETEHLDVFTCPKAFAEAKKNLAKWRVAMPAESASFVCHEREEAIEVSWFGKLVRSGAHVGPLQIYLCSFSPVSPRTQLLYSLEIPPLGRGSRLHFQCRWRDAPLPLRDRAAVHPQQPPLRHVSHYRQHPLTEPTL